MDSQNWMFQENAIQNNRYELIVPPPNSSIYVCSFCGAVVWDQRTHDRFHDRLSDLAVLVSDVQRLKGNSE